MRPTPLLTFAAALSLASAAAAQPLPRAPAPRAPVSAVPPAADETPLPSAAEDQAAAEAMTAQLAALDARIGSDEARFTQLRDYELGLENARIRAIKPALPLKGITWIQFSP